MLVKSNDWSQSRRSLTTPNRIYQQGTRTKVRAWCCMARIPLPVRIGLSVILAYLAWVATSPAIVAWLPKSELTRTCQFDDQADQGYAYKGFHLGVSLPAWLACAQSQGYRVYQVEPNHLSRSEDIVHFELAGLGQVIGIDKVVELGRYVACGGDTGLFNPADVVGFGRKQWFDVGALETVAGQKWKPRFSFVRDDKGIFRLYEICGLSWFSPSMAEAMDKELGGQSHEHALYGYTWSQGRTVVEAFELGTGPYQLSYAYKPLMDKAQGLRRDQYLSLVEQSGKTDSLDAFGLVSDTASRQDLGCLPRSPAIQPVR